MKRRAFLAVLGLGLFVGLPVAGAQQAAGARRIGVLHLGSPPDPWVEGLREGLRELGYTEGRNITIEYRWAEGRADRLPELAAELVRLPVDVVVTMAGPAVQAVKQRTASIPIVMAVSGDPVGLGLVPSLARPGGNVTGVSLMSADLAAKRLQLLKEAVPRMVRVGVLFNPSEPPSGPEMEETRAAAAVLGLTLQPLEARDAGDLERLFATASHERANGLITFAHTFAFSHRSRIAGLAAKHRLPAMYGWPEFVEAGGLMAYGPRLSDVLRRAAAYVDKILKGAKPADLPVEQPTRFELVVNMKTAKSLGLTIPPSILVRADQVIQ